MTWTDYVGIMMLLCLIPVLFAIHAPLALWSLAVLPFLVVGAFIFFRSVKAAFQVTDDLLDVTGEEHAVGKRVGKDGHRGKLTYPGLLGEGASRQLVEELVNSACAAVDTFGERGKPLAELAKAFEKTD